MTSVFSCGIFLWSENRTSFLLLRQGRRWDLPKGHQEKGEAALATALRELQEETGILPQQVKVIPGFCYRETYQTRYRRLGGKLVDKTLTIYMAELLEPAKVTVSEHTGFQWHQWNPPHQIQEKTIDPLLNEVQQLLASYESVD